jgi:hypothetical protein
MSARPLILAWSLSAAVLASGCIEHRARVANPVGDARADQAIVGGEAVEVFASPDEIVVPGGARPVDATIDAWRHDESGTVLRWRGRVRTPLPWWQRFPCDVATDLWPGELACEATATVACVPVAARDPAELAASARRDGYARQPEPAAAAPREVR